MRAKKKRKQRRKGRDLKTLAGVTARFFAFPLLLYFVFFCALTFPLILKFSTHLFSMGGDGLSNYWNLWWVNKAATELHQSVWYTNYLYYPDGISLLSHSLSLFNGFLGIFLQKFLTLSQTYNFIVIFSFVAAGYTAFLLAHSITGSYWGSLIAGYIFTFSNYHFAHAAGHMNLISLEWIPVFILFWYGLMTKPSVTNGIAAAIAIFAVLLCDHYYFSYCLLSAVIIAAYFLRKKEIRSRWQEYKIPCLCFLQTFLLTSGLFVACLIYVHLNNPLQGGHTAPESYSLDLPSLVIPGKYWCFSSLTEPYWKRLPGLAIEHSTHLGVAVVFLLIYAWAKRKSLQVRHLNMWYSLILFFFVMSLGPTLHVWGEEISASKLPYEFLVMALPILKVGGIPIRMMIMVYLCAAILCAASFEVLFRESRKKRYLAFALLLLLFTGYLPGQMSTYEISYSRYAGKLARLPGKGGIIDLVSDPSLALLYQTYHQKPMAFGLVSRLPASLFDREPIVRALVFNEQYSELCQDYHLRYLVVPASEAPLRQGGGRPIFQDEEAMIFDLGADCEM